ncbi:MAG: radical SAM family heme chaperone HemW [Candidatus Cloacimonadota bacterium]|nr:radical SAM family heme chaperone HemW [Candidatus Cloacimonadota bacterium]
MLKITSKKKIAVYIHIPFCTKKCAYCGFYSVNYDADSVERYFKNLRNSISNFPYKNEYEVSTIYFGGGTPSLIPFHQLYSVVSAIVNNFSVNKNAEVTLEANPLNISKSSAKDYRILGINRISLGAQSFIDSELKSLGRLHTHKEIQPAVENIRRNCTENISLDLMFGIPSQSKKTWETSLQKAAELNPNHISSYCLSLENNTYMKNNASSYDFPDEDLQREMYYFMLDFLAENGLEQYEISNFSKSGYKSKHNLAYWHGDEYIGFGAAAHSFYKMRRIANPANIENYCGRIEDGNYPFESDKEISEREFISDKIVLGLRLSEGIYLPEFKNKYNFDVEKNFKKIISQLIKSDFLMKKDNRLKLTRKALFVSNSILSEFI